MAQATNQIIAEEGPVINWIDTEIYNLYKKKIVTAKECKLVKGCFEQGAVRFLDDTLDDNWNNSNSTYKLVIQDGMQIFFSTWKNSTCTANSQGSKNFCTRFIIDINGGKKPNKYGYDIFVFLLKNNGLYPAGCDEDGYCNKTKKGYDCACKVLRENAINY